MDRVERPLSPHLQVYRPQITMVLSIMHRGTGLALSLGVLVLAYWLMAVAVGEAAYSDARVLLSSSLLKFCYIGWGFCFFYHLANGVRHLVWDLGIGLERGQYQVSGWIVILFTFVASACYVLVVII
jgi:succinate dehydrogenase / fumarate reductase cytochrome b subunit